MVPPWEPTSLKYMPYVTSGVSPNMMLLEIVVPGIVIFALVVLTAWGVYRRQWVGFLGAWFFLALGPSSFATLGQNAFQHRMYLSLAGVIALVVVLAEYWLRKQLARRLGQRGSDAASFGILAVIVSAFVLMTYERNKDYHDPIAFWQDNVKKRPQSFVAENNLGAALVDAERCEEAFGHFHRSLEINPDFVDAHSNWGNALNLRGDYEGAMKHYREALRLEPTNPSAHNNWGELLTKLGRFEEAISHFQEVVNIGLRGDEPRCRVDV